MKYGVLTFNPQNQDIPLTGKIACRVISAALQLRTEDKRGNGNAPDYSVWAKENGNVYQLGNGWLKRGENGEFISITMDSPDMDVPLNVTAFPVKGSDQWDIVWTRPRQDRKKAVQPVDNEE